MVPSAAKTIPLFEGITMSSGATVFGVVDTLGFDYCEIDLIAGTGDAASTALDTLALCEDDTTPTAYSDGDPVTQFVGAAAVSTSAGFVLPPLSSSVDNVYRFNVDLKGRKRYLGLDIAVEKITLGVIAVARLSRVADGADIKVVGTAVAGNQLIVSG